MSLLKFTHLLKFFSFFRTVMYKCVRVLEDYCIRRLKIYLSQMTVDKQLLILPGEGLRR